MKLIAHSRFLPVSCLLAADGLFFGLSDPASVSSFALIIGFVLFAVTLYQLLYGLLALSSWYGLSWDKRTWRRLAGTTTGVIGGLVALQSIGELGGRDVVVLVPLAVGLYLYNTYATRTRRAVGAET